jgi:hypothetical protein
MGWMAALILAKKNNRLSFFELVAMFFVGPVLLTLATIMSMGETNVWRMR